MDNLLLQHGCASHYNVPDGLKELMSDITREVLREQPHKIFNFVADYLSVLLITRENSMIAFKVLHDLCDCKPMLVEHLVQLGFTRSNATLLAVEIKREVESEEPVPGQEHTQELFIIKKILSRTQLDEEITSKVSKIAINTYREYWYKKKAMEKCVEINTDEPWEEAVERTLDIYKKTNPSMIEFNRAAEIIQAAYYHYYNHRTMLNHLVKKPEAPATEEKPKKTKLGVLRRKLDKKVNVELGSMLCIESKDHSTEERNMTQKITHILNDEEDSVPVENLTLNLGGKKLAKKAFKFVEPNTQKEPEVTVSYTQVAICPKFGKTEQNLGSLLQNENEISVTMDTVVDGAGDNNEIIPEIIQTQNEYDEESDDYDIPEDFSDTDSGPRNHTPVSATDALISDIEEDYNEADNWIYAT